MDEQWSPKLKSGIEKVKQVEERRPTTFGTHGHSTGDTQKKGFRNLDLEWGDQAGNRNWGQWCAGDQ